MKFLSYMFIAVIALVLGISTNSYAQESVQIDPDGDTLSISVYDSYQNQVAELKVYQHISDESTFYYDYNSTTHVLTISCTDNTKVYVGGSKLSSVTLQNGESGNEPCLWVVTTPLGGFVQLQESVDIVPDGDTLSIPVYDTYDNYVAEIKVYQSISDNSTFYASYDTYGQTLTIGCTLNTDVYVGGYRRSYVTVQNGDASHDAVIWVDGDPPANFVDLL